MRALAESSGGDCKPLSRSPRCPSLQPGWRGQKVPRLEAAARLPVRKAAGQSEFQPDSCASPYAQSPSKRRAWRAQQWPTLRAAGLRVASRASRCEVRRSGGVVRRAWVSQPV
eukprot:scaffold72753_cov35-Tisochrysis_lutea.AAC.1